MDLFTIWKQLMESLSCFEQKEMFDHLLLSYQEPSRHYHTKQHLISCFIHYEMCQAKMKDPLIVALALFYHDVVYDVHRLDNEQRSAEAWHRDGKKLGLSNETIENVARMILATQNHKAQDADTQIFLDIDLSILGEQEEVFDRFERDIRAEYIWIPEEIFRNRRAQILREFLERDQIFCTSSFRSLETQARKNLLRCIVELSGDRRACVDKIA